jgi:putative ABC transport system permease protein
MIASYLKFAWRHLVKDRQFSFLNLVGLSTGLAAAILIYLWIYDELHVDRYFGNDAQLYQVMSNNQQDDQVSTSDNHSIILGDALQKEIPEIIHTATTTPAFWFKKFNITFGDVTLKATGNFASNNYFTVFPYQLLHGNRATLLSDKNAIVISEKLAKKLFKSTDQAIGKVMQWTWYTIKHQCIITGVYKEAPANATHQFDFILSLDAWTKDIMPGNGIPDISGGPFNTFVVVRKGVDIDRLNATLAPFISGKFPRSNTTLFIRKYSSQHLYGNYVNGKQDGGRIAYVKLFSLIAIFILAIACINFMNLSTARASKRMKEVGIKKTLGVSRSALVLSFLGESVLMSLAALLFALALVAILLPGFNNLTGKELVVPFDWSIVQSILGITLLTGLMAGSYPALYLSRFRPALTLKGKFISSAAELWVRKGLVVFQFSISIVFIIAVMVVYKQVKYVQTINPGYDKDHVICFEMEGKTAGHMDAFLAGIKNIPGVVNAGSSQIPMVFDAWKPHGGVYWDDKNKNDEIRFHVMAVNYDIIETLGLQVTQGRPFSKAFSTDTAAIIINETAAKAMALTAPIGKTITTWGKQKQIVGLVKDFHFNSLHETVKPFIFQLSPAETMVMMVRIDRGHEANTIKAIQDYYRKFNPGFALEYNYLDEAWQAQYKSEQLIATLSKYFAVLTVIISCLGLFGLAAFTAESRRKEIGIRKVLGASVNQIAGLLSKEFLQLVICSILIAFPLAWWCMNVWLQSFAYRIDMEETVFVIAAVAIMMITLLTISFQAIRSALANPVGSLRSEQ